MVDRNALCVPTINYQLFAINFFNRRAQPDRYPDFGFKPHSAFPSRVRGAVALEFVAVTVAQPLRIFTGFPDI